MLTQTEKFFKIFADKNRLRILKLLERRKMCVCELAFVLGVTQPSVSRHLKKMKETGLIGDEQDRFWTNYYLLEGSRDNNKIMSSIKSLLRSEAIACTAFGIACSFFRNSSSVTVVPSKRAKILLWSFLPEEEQPERSKTSKQIVIFFIRADYTTEKGGLAIS